MKKLKPKGKGSYRVPSRAVLQHLGEKGTTIKDYSKATPMSLAPDVTPEVTEFFPKKKR